MREENGIYLSAAELIALKPRCNALSLPMNQPAASALAGAYRSRFRGRGVDFVESRNYLPGDDIRNLDWRVTARTGKPHTKIFQEERERPVLVVVDASPSLYFGTRTRLKSVAAGQLAAAIAGAGGNVEELNTDLESAPMAGHPVFHATGILCFPPEVEPADITTALENLSPDLSVSLGSGGE